MGQEEIGLTWRDRLRATWNALVGGIGMAMGLLPHILHHVGFLAGTALVAGSGGTSLFGALGFLFSVPMLLRLRRRFGTWHAPAIALLIFAAMFSLSAFVIGPAISGGGNATPTSVPGTGHLGHH
jgi:predicted PurR-regulated permease PerM